MDRSDRCLRSPQEKVAIRSLGGRESSQELLTLHRLSSRATSNTVAVSMSPLAEERNAMVRVAGIGDI